MSAEAIAAIATAAGSGAIGIVRISGSGALEVAARVFKASGSKTDWPTHTILHGYIMDGDTILDEVMCAYMRAPRSYTGEDTVEVYCHGGSVVLHGVLRACLKSGARLAEPGEFTKLAFLNGRMDLSQAEAVMTLINAKSEYGRTASLHALGGGFSHTVRKLRSQILKWMTHIALSIDYPEHAREAMNLGAISAEGMTLLNTMRKLIATAEVGRVITHGVKAAIAGRPNVGKSTLLNAILREERAIVTNIPGTTRDVLTEAVNISGVPVILSDTAGIRESADDIEKIGVERSAAYIKGAELVLLVLDATEPIQGEDLLLADILGSGKGEAKRNVIVLVNKCDLNEGFNKSFGNEYNGIGPIIPISAKTGYGLDDLYAAVKNMYISGQIHAGDDIVLHIRHRHLLETAASHMQQALSAIDAGFTEDLISIDLNFAYISLGEIIGEAVGDDVIDNIFREFCLGK